LVAPARAADPEKPHHLRNKRIRIQYLANNLRKPRTGWFYRWLDTLCRPFEADPRTQAGSKKSLDSIPVAKARWR